MLNRRTLFARLSAVALAPFAKWLPKGEGIRFFSYVGPSDSYHAQSLYLPDWADVSVTIVHRRESEDGAAKARRMVDYLRKLEAPNA